MPWVRISDDWWQDLRVLGLSVDARDLFVRFLSFAGGKLTDGFIPIAAVTLVAQGPADVVLAELEQAAFMERRTDGWLIVGWQDYLRSAADVERGRAERARAGRVGGRGRSGAPRDARGRYLSRAPPP